MIDPFTMLLIGVILSVAAFFGGYCSAKYKQQREAIRLARQMADSVRAVKSSRLPEDMMPYTNRQRTAGNKDNPIRARQGKVRFRTSKRYTR